MPSKVNLRSWYQQKLRDRNPLFSMAVLASIDKINYGEENPYYRGRKEVGTVRVPSELRMLQNLKDAANIQIVYYEEVKPKYRGKMYSYAIGIWGLHGLGTTITIYYGVDSSNMGNSGIVGIGFALQGNDKAFSFAIKEPEKFTITDIVNIFNGGIEAVDQFALEHGDLTRHQRDLITRSGLY